MANKKKSGFSGWINEIRKRKKGILFSIIFFVFVGILNYFAGNFADRPGGVSVSDTILDRLPVFNIPEFYVYGIFTVIGFLLIYSLVFRIHQFSYTLFQFGLLVGIRNIFITLTHLGSPANSIPISFPWPISAWAFDQDLFFSGHVGIPLLGFFIFKGNKIRWVFLALSIVMGATTLLTHRHYSVDVFAAIFITYSSYRLGKWISESKYLKDIIDKDSEN